MQSADFKRRVAADHTQKMQRVRESESAHLALLENLHTICDQAEQQRRSTGHRTYASQMPAAARSRDED